ncbi:uncharacterized protein PRCAT00003619001 [Priceomyces carsonii]|uniref:uncharacterized protein n=1 Tax=Priceomyces carsonii TaxID=28549 RepID=UPI002ED9B782|nr:unnamed protein product [Priceomyces carsonii]
MVAVDYRVTSLLTEHLGYPPLALVDDVINAVNVIMYSCTTEIERYLMERQQKQYEDTTKSPTGDRDVLTEYANEKYPTEEIQVGTGKLETLLESQIDTNFDKFELYTLRNIFMIPQQLVDDGWIRLKHQEGIDFNKSSTELKSDLDNKLKDLVRDIKFELHLRKILKLQILKAQKVIRALNVLKKNIKFLELKDEGSALSQEAKTAFKSLSPIDESLYFLFNQVTELVLQMQEIMKKVSSNVKNGGIRDMKFVPSLRDKYTDGVSLKILENIGVLAKNPHHLSEALKTVEATTLSDLESVKNINQGLEHDPSSLPQRSRQDAEDEIQIDMIHSSIEE